MRKFFLLSLIFVVPAVTALSQQRPDDTLLKKYADTSHRNCTDCFYYLGLNNNVSINEINRVNNLATRKFSDNNFIIQKSKLEKLHLPQTDIRYFVPANNYWKLSPRATQLIFSNTTQTTYRFTVSLKNKEAAIRIIQQNKSMPGLYLLKDQDMISFISTYKNVEKIFLNNEDVLFIDVQTQKPKEELALPGFDFSVNKINMVHSRFPLINGSGEGISIKEQLYDTTDIDLTGRLLPSPNAASSVTNHATIIATIAAGGGNSVYYAKGVAWAANISSSSFDNIFPDDNSYYQGNNIYVQNHSYGSAIDNNYGLNAVAFDKNANDIPGLLHVFSSGNSGEDISTSGKYSGISNFANLTGNYKMAKNTLLVAATDSFGLTPSFSSAGPAYDGRLKPDISAFQSNGTSESSAVVSGAVLLLQQYYKSKSSNALPSALAKAILINTADDINRPGPDYTTGFGNLNAIKAITAIRDNTIFSGSVAQGNARQFIINVPVNIARLKVSLVWNDTVATAFAPKALINDLDLQVSSVTSSQTWLPWVLSSFPDKDSLTALPVRKRDSLNNAEQVTIDNPAAGDYKINVSAYNIPQGAQQFYVVYGYDTANNFQWEYPASADFLQAGNESILRWGITFTGTGDIEYKSSTNTWIPVAQNVDLSKKYFRWAVPDTITPCLLRMKIGAAYFYSDTFLITSLLNPMVGFVCTDSLLLFWNKLPNTAQYQVYMLGQKYMEPFAQTADTIAVLPINKLTSKYFSVAPVLNNDSAGVKSYAFDYTLQGIGCYIKTFLTYSDSDTARLSLSLGTTFRVKEISFERLTSSGFIPVYNTPVNNNPDFAFNFSGLSTGTNIFRAKITLQNGQIIYSDNGLVYYAEKGKYLLFPVPASRHTNIEIYTPSPDGEFITLFDAMGRTVLQKAIIYPHEFINTSLLLPGEYFYRITKQNIKAASGKLLIL